MKIRGANFRKNYLGESVRIILVETSQGEVCASIIQDNRFVSFRCYRNSVEFPFGSPRLISGARPSLASSERSDRQVEGVENMLPAEWGSAISQPPPPPMAR